MRRAARVDANHAAIRDALRQVGCSVCDASRLGDGAPDLLVWSPRTGHVLLEVKTEYGRLTHAQEAFHARFPVVIVRSVDQALKAVGLRLPSVRTQKDGGV